MGTSPTSQSAPLSNAAKDDILNLDNTFTFTVNQLLANDAGSANSFFFGSGDNGGLDQDAVMANLGIEFVSADNGGTYRFVGGEVTDFDYTVRIGGKGTYSTGSVSVTAPEPEDEPHLSGTELLTNWNFEDDDADNADGYINVAAVAGWDNLDGTTNPMQIQHESFGFVTGFAPDEDQWLDTAGSPGNVHIGQTIDLAEGATAQLSVSVAAEQVAWAGLIYQPDANDHLLFVFNDVVVKDISLADFTTNGVVNWNEFQDFTMDVTGVAGADHFEIQTTGMETLTTDLNGAISGAAGFAIDHVSLQEWII